jgi:AcrR family transcriptional regulator
VDARLRSPAEDPRRPSPIAEVHERGDSVEGFTISVLAERSGTHIPTIHHYRRIGLLPPADEVASNRFLYHEEHVEALVIIRLLRQRRNLPLEAIREVLPALLALPRDGDMSEEMWDKVILSHLERSGPGAISNRLVAAARTCFAERGYASVNVADICKAANIAKGSFYRYFDSKEAIFLAAARSTVDAVGEQLDQLPERMSERQATEKLKNLMRPMAPLLLEVATGELLHQPALVGVLGLIATGLATRLMPRLGTKGAAARSAARRVVDDAVSSLLTPTLQSSA